MRALVLAILLTGCVGAPGADVASQSNSAPASLVDAMAALDAGEPSANLALVGEWRSGGGSEVAAFGDLLYVMRGGGVTVLDVSDPDDIKEVAEIRGPHGVLDVKLSFDGKFLFIGEDAEGGHDATAAAGVSQGGLYVYDVSDPKSATLVDFLPIGPRRGPHMVFYHRYPDGREILFGANADVSISEFDREAGTLTLLARYSPDLVLAFNREPYVFDALYQGWAHDMFVATEPDGSVLMYVANWDAGLRLVDVSDPASPAELGGWNDFPEGHSGNLHTVSADWFGDKRIVVGAVEVGFAVVGGIGYAQGAEPGVVYVWDATDPAAPTLLGQWENPLGVKAGGRPMDDGVKSTHNLQFEEGMIHLAHYGLGVWILDASTPETWASPAVLAYAMEGGQSTWDVILHDGIMWTSGAEGILGFEFPLLTDGITSRA